MWRKEGRDPEMSAEHRGAALRYGLRDGWRDGGMEMCVFRTKSISCAPSHQRGLLTSAPPPDTVVLEATRVH